MRKLVVGIALVFILINISAQESNVKTMAKSVSYFTRYINWPSEMAKGNFKIGVYGSFNLYKELIEVSNSMKGIPNANVDVMNLVNLNLVSALDFHIVIIAKEKCTLETMRELKVKLGNKATLIITDKDGFINHGSMINFVVVNDKLTYEIKKLYAENTGLAVGREIVGFATKVF